MLFVKWLVIVPTLLIMLGIVALGTIYSHRRSDGVDLPKSTPWFVAIFGLFPSILYTVVILSNLYAIDLLILSNVSLGAIALCALFIGLILLRSKLYLVYTKFWLNLAESQQTKKRLAQKKIKENQDPETPINEDAPLRY